MHTYSTLYAEVARFLGLGTNYDDWQQHEIRYVDAIVRDGYQHFLSPPPVNPYGHHEWSFLEAASWMATSADKWQYTLPWWVGDLEGNWTYEPTTLHSKVTLVSEGQIRERRQHTSQTGRPRLVSTRATVKRDSTTQYWEVLLWPTPDATYRLHYRYRVTPPRLGPENPNPYGGQEHSLTLLQACLAIAEQRENDEQGVQTAQFRSRLRASIQRDRLSNAPRSLGFHGSGSPHRDSDRQRTSKVVHDADS